MVQPRFNFVQLIGLLCITTSLYNLHTEYLQDLSFSLFSVTVTLLLLFVGLAFFSKKKWARSASIILFLLVVSTIIENFIDYIQDPFGIGSYYILRMVLSDSFLILGFFLLVFNIMTATEFYRKRKEPIDYAKVQLNEGYLLKNSINLTTCFGLILISPFIELLVPFYYKVSFRSFSFYNLEQLLDAITMVVSLVCGIGFFLKIKITQYFTILLTLLMLISSFIINKFSSYTFVIDPFLSLGLKLGWCAIFIALIFHPIVTHSFDNKTKLIKDYDDILDLE